MTSSLRELEHELLRETGRRLIQFGFSANPKGQTFERGIDGGRVAIHLTFIEHASDFDVTVDIGIRFDAVEDLVHRSNKLLSKKDRAKTFSLGAELGNLDQGKPFRIAVATSRDIECAAAGIASKLETVGLPYIEKYSHPEAAYGLLSRDDREVWVHSPIHAERAKRACALLAVTGRRSEIADIGARKLAFLESINDPGATAFSRFLAELQGGESGPV